MICFSGFSLLVFIFHFPSMFQIYIINEFLCFIMQFSLPSSSTSFLFFLSLPFFCQSLFFLHLHLHPFTTFILRLLSCVYFLLSLSLAFSSFSTLLLLLLLYPPGLLPSLPTLLPPQYTACEVRLPAIKFSISCIQILIQSLAENNPISVINLGIAAWRGQSGRA